MSFAKTRTGRGLENFWRHGDKSGIRTELAKTYKEILRILDGLERLDNVKDMRLHRWRRLPAQWPKNKPLPWSLDASGSVRVIFVWKQEEGIGHAYEVDIWAH